MGPVELSVGRVQHGGCWIDGAICVLVVTGEREQSKLMKQHDGDYNGSRKSEQSKRNETKHDKRYHYCLIKNMMKVLLLFDQKQCNNYYHTT